MFKIDPTANRINPLEVKRFSGFGFIERKHLQECLENYLQALARGDGEELLIVQKEFDGFDDTRERLNLLAIIENKLDDSGRDVVLPKLLSGQVALTEREDFQEALVSKEMAL